MRKPGAAHARLGSALLIALLVGGPAGARDQGVEARGSATLGVNLYVLSPPFDSDDITGFFDQYRYLRAKDRAIPNFVDLLHFDLGAARDDDTYVLRLERFSRNDINSDTRFDFDWRGFEVEAGYRRYRSDSLRFFPQGTDGPNPNGLGVSYAPDVDFDDLFDSNRRIDVKREGGGGELTFTPRGFDLDLPVLTHVSGRGSTQRRTGFRQDSFLQDGRENQNPSTRFRGNRREIDQSVTAGGTTLGFSPWGWFSGNAAFDIEGFREDADVVTLGDLAVPGSGIVPGSGSPNREFDYVPDTDRLTGSLTLGRRVAGATFHANAFVSHLEQVGEGSLLQQENDLALNRVTTVSAAADFDAPLWRFIGVDGFVKYLYRDNDIDPDAFDAISGGQESPLLRRRDEVKGSLELTASPSSGMRFAVGYRGDYTDRDLEYAPDADFGIKQPNSLIRAKTVSHTAFLSGRVRLLRTLQLSGELAGIWAPEVAYARDLTEAVSFRARSSYTLPQPVPFPVTLSLNGRVLDGRNDDFEIEGTRPGVGRAKDFERTEWGYDITLAAVPVPTLSLFATFAHDVDDQRFGHVRTDVPRYQDGDGLPDFLRVDYFLDSLPTYESEARSLTGGGRALLFERLDFALTGAFTWVDARAGGASTGDRIDGANRIEGRIITVESDLDYPLTKAVSVGIGYRLQQYLDESKLDPLDLDETRHTITLRATIDFSLLQ